MKNTKYILLICIALYSVKSIAQDKLFMRNGSMLKCKISSIAANTVSYRDTIETAPTITVSKEQVLMAEYKTGQVYIFSKPKNELVIEQPSLINNNETREQRKERKMKEWKKQEETLSNNVLGFYLPPILFGRLGVSYERFFANKTMGIKIPAILTYDPSGVWASTASSNTNTAASQQAPNKGVGFITGIDINYYTDLKPEVKYYFGPRVRYGTDMLLGGLEGLTVQLQNGIFRSRGKRFTNTIGIGFGFFKLSQKYANYPGYSDKQVYPSGSVTWRLGFRI